MKYDLAIIGGGPGGYVAAIKAAQSGLKTVLFEEKKPGGTCLNQGCIPTKALLKSAAVYQTALDALAYGIHAPEVRIEWERIQQRRQEIVGRLVGGVQYLLEANHVEIVNAHAELSEAHQVKAGDTIYEADHIILATGSESVCPPIEGIDLASVVTSAELLEIPSVPQRLAIIGGGVIGLEFAHLFAKFGSEVVVVEALGHILPNADDDIRRAVQALLKRQGVRIETSTTVTRVEANGVYCRSGESEHFHEANCVLVAVGRKPHIDIAMLDRLNITHERGVVTCDETMRTSLPSVYAIGDLNGKYMLAHTASKEAEIAVANILGKSEAMDYDYIPSCLYLEPEVAFVGMSESDAKEAGIAVKTARFPMSANGKSMIENDNKGFIKIVADENSERIIGAHLFCSHATDMISELTMAIRSGLTCDEIGSLIHPHPTVSEAVMEAAAAVFGKAVHSL
jgi:dihydrolipoamide dehydrogenase